MMKDKGFVANNTDEGTDALVDPAGGGDDAYTAAAVSIGVNRPTSPLQLGYPDTSIHIYRAIHTRSDMRDMTDVRDAALGLEFIDALRPVDFRRDCRDAYVEEDGTGVPRDGSRAGKRFHHGLVAQEVKAAADRLGVDFGGYRDHKIADHDVPTLAYDEFVAPLIKAVQELSERVGVLEGAQRG